MPLPFIVEPPPGDRGFDTWAYAHAIDHIEIISAITRTYSITLPTYDLWPINPQDIEGWLKQHEQAHNDMNLQMATPGNDLGHVDFKDANQAKAWFWINWQEHNNVRQKLAI